MQQKGYRTAHYGKWHLGGGGGIHGHPETPFLKEYGYDDTRTWNGNGPTWCETTPVLAEDAHPPVLRKWIANSIQADYRAVRFQHPFGVHDSMIELILPIRKFL